MNSEMPNTDASGSSKLYELVLPNRRLLHITSFGNYREGFHYKGLQLRIGWAGYIMRSDGSKFTLAIDANPATGIPDFPSDQLCWQAI